MPVPKLDNTSKLSICALYGMSLDDACAVTGCYKDNAYRIAKAEGIKFGEAPKPPAPVWVKPDVAEYALMHGKMPGAVK